MHKKRFRESRGEISILFSVSLVGPDIIRQTAYAQTGCTERAGTNSMFVTTKAQLMEEFGVKKKVCYHRIHAVKGSCCMNGGSMEAL